MNGYIIAMAAAALAGLGLLLLRLNRRGMPLGSGVLGWAVSCALAFLCAKVFYVLLLFGRVWPRYGWEALTRMKGEEFCFFFGCVGAVLGMALTARIGKINVGRFLDAFAPCGAVMAAGARFAEKYLGMVGAGVYVDDPAFCRFPFAVSDPYFPEEWKWAVFMLEAAVALTVAVVFFLKKKENRLPGLCMEKTAFYLAAPQIFCESLRTQCLKWGFVRVEQVLCGICLLALLIYSCAKTKESSFVKRFWPVFAALCGIAVIVGVEFGLDKTDIPSTAWYALMLVMLAGFGILERFCSGRRLSQAQQK